jgi:hypothetical protein
MNAKRFAMIGCFFGTILQLCSQGYLVPNGVTYAGYFPPFIGYEIHVLQHPSGDYTGFGLRTEDGETFQFSLFADEGVRTFLVSYNEPISLQPILAQNYTELTYPNAYVFDNGVPFYVGLYTGYSPMNGIYSNPLFGWAELVNNNGAIQLLDSALEYGGIGIYAGTQTIIPEPSTIGLLVIGGLLFVHARRKYC